jgi:hypothetical protein
MAVTTPERGGGGGGGSHAPSPEREGLRVKIEPIPGLTGKNLMGRDGFYFQCPPLEEFAPVYGYTHTQYDTIRKGQFSRKGGRKLRTVSFDTLVVDFANWTVVARLVEIEEFNNKLIRLSESGDPFLLTVAHQMPPRGYDDWGETLAGPELQMEATLDEIRVAEKAGEGDARYMSVSFTEYRDPFTEREAKGKARRPTKKFPKTVLLQRDGRASDKETGLPIGDPPAQPLTMARIAKFYYHDTSEWRTIATHNKNKITNWGANDSLLIFFETRKNKKNWPVKITVPAPPGGGIPSPHYTPPMGQDYENGR